MQIELSTAAWNFKTCYNIADEWFSWQYRVLHGFLAIVATLSTKFYLEYTFTHES